jgi:hypothetical protein
VFHHEPLDQPPADESRGAGYEDARTRQLLRAYGPILPTDL